MAADEKLKFTIKELNNFETVRPICTKFGMHHPLRTRNKPVVKNVEIYNRRWPPAAILKLAKTKT